MKSYLVCCLALICVVNLGEAQKTPALSAAAAELTGDAALEIERGDRSTTCDCANSSCSCCRQVTYSSFFLKIDETACMNVVVLGDQYTLSVTLGGELLYFTTERMGTLKTACARYRIANVCLSFRDVTWGEGTMGACVTADIKFWRFTIDTIDLGCFEVV